MGAINCNCKTDALIKHVQGNVLRLAIPLTIKIRDLVDGHPTEREEDFYPDASRGVKIVLDASYITRTFDGVVSGNVVSMEDVGTLKLGNYQVTVLCYDNSGIPYRYMARNIIAIVDATADAGIEAGIEFDSETYTLEGAYFIKGEKGDKGDPFTYDDFTPEQIAELQRPATEAAELANEAAQLAQEVASHPDMVGDNGNWWRWNTSDDEYQDTGIPALNVVTYDINGSTGELQMTVIDGMDYPNMQVVEGNLVLEVNS